MLELFPFRIRAQLEEITLLSGNPAGEPENFKS
jgi:hypothetical protein